MLDKITAQLGPNYDPIFFDVAFIGGKVEHRIIDVILPPDLQLKE